MKKSANLMKVDLSSIHMYDAKLYIVVYILLTGQKAVSE